jgi:hypothetical protein
LAMRPFVMIVISFYNKEVFQAGLYLLLCETNLLSFSVKQTQFCWTRVVK